MKGRYIYKFKIDRDHVFLHLYYLLPGRDVEKVGDTRVKRGEQFEDLLLSHQGVDFVGWNPKDGIERAMRERGEDD